MTVYRKTSTATSDMMGDNIRDMLFITPVRNAMILITWHTARAAMNIRSSLSVRILIFPLVLR